MAVTFVNRVHRGLVTPILPFNSPNSISRAGPSTLLLFRAKNFDYFVPFLKNIFCHVTPDGDVIDGLQVFCSSTALRCSVDQSMANGGALFLPRGSRFRVNWTPLQMKANWGLHRAGTRWGGRKRMRGGDGSTCLCPGAAAGRGG